jgi:hypothetical protein
MTATVTADDGTMLPVDSLPMFFAYSGNFISTITCYYAGKEFIKSFSNNGTDITYISNWQSQTPPVPGSEVMITEAGLVMITEQGSPMYTE